MFNRISPHSRCVLQALFVTFLWSTSWVLIKIGLQDIPALSFAGLRYLLAFVFLLPFTLRAAQRAQLRQLPRRVWLFLIALGVVYYALTQGSQFLALAYLPAATVTLMLSFTTILVAFLGMAFLNERPALGQWAGLGLYLVGVLVYFTPLDMGLIAAQQTGLVIALAGVLTNALGSVMGRSINRSAVLDPSAVTVVSMGVGALILFAAGVSVQGLPALSPQNWLIVLWLAAVNSAFAFTLWNRTLRHLTAVQSSIINNTMLFQISILAWIFLGEQLTTPQIFGIILAASGTLIVQLRQKSISTR